MSRAANLVLWVVQVARAAIFIFAGSKKLVSDPQMVAVFAKVGIGQWFRILTGTLEVVGGVLLLVPRFAAAAAAMLACVMVGATAAHLTVLGSPPTLALVLLAACLAIAWFRRRQLRLA